ncbi:hypothetical protein [Hydrogenophaga taeniospiralis]|uniref:hypothetical protein n=1 Tax=Hydrogenophaga taeniospiralis TaxID=65656 RepID=UPI000B238DC5|nr:hypothetical protein [Hydrogenophaga taeniospiralis]
MSEILEGWLLEQSVSAKPHLRQGDLVLFRESKDPMRMAGIVVTADCDLKNRKHAQLVTLVPLLTVQAILERYLFLEACESLSSQLRSCLCKKYAIDLNEDLLLIDVRLRELLTRPEVPAIDSVAVRLILGLQEQITTASYRDLMKMIGGAPKSGGAFETQLQKRGDLVILPSAEILGVKGRIAWVRHLWQVPVGEIALKTSDTKYCDGEFVARLDSPFRYRLTQVMAQVFSDIGLPDGKIEFKSEIEGVMGNA